LTNLLKSIFKSFARQTIGRLPPPKSRLAGRLALEGGRPVRDIRFRPWAKYHGGDAGPWWFGLSRAMRSVFVSGVEGLPQPLAKKFGQKWAEICGCRFGILLPHGTDALRLALAAALDHDGLDYGGEVIVPNYSFIASATAALDRRFGVALVDVDPGTLLIDPAEVERAIVPGRTCAIMAVHLFGQPADMTALGEIARRHNLKLIEDSAQAHGAAWESGACGSLGDAAGFSFQSFKNLNCGEGGALTTNDEQIFDRAYSLHNAGRARIGGGRWEHVSLGWNCRPTEYQAAILLHRLARFERQQTVRRTNFDLLRGLVGELRCVEPLTVHTGVRKHGVHMFAMRYKAERCGDLSIDSFLETCGAEGAPLYRGFAATISDQPAMQKLMATRPDYIRVLPTPVADAAAQQLICISHDVLLGTDRDMHEIAACIRKVENHYASQSGKSLKRETLSVSAA
jgi:dTDP-4-amino-4,6-dideoxygalactose transaminase